MSKYIDIDDVLMCVCVVSGNKWDCDRDFQWVLNLHERGVLFNGDNLKCRDNSQNNSWFEWNYSIIRRETNKKVKLFFKKTHKNSVNNCTCLTPS